jgi:hypothetical protein
VQEYRYFAGDCTSFCINCLARLVSIWPKHHHYPTIYSNALTSVCPCDKNRCCHKMPSHPGFCAEQPRLGRWLPVPHVSLHHTTCLPANHPSSRRQAGAWAETEARRECNVLRPCEFRKDDGRSNSLGCGGDKRRRIGNERRATRDGGEETVEREEENWVRRGFLTERHTFKQGRAGAWAETEARRDHQCLRWDTLLGSRWQVVGRYSA